MKPTRGLAWCALLGVIGLGLAGYLFYLHLGFLRGELLGGPACGTGVFNCHAVTQGAWGSVLGMPLALWGILGYLTIVSLALFGKSVAEAAAPALTLIFALALSFVLIDLVLLLLMALVIRFFCLFCLLTYAVNLALLIVAARAVGLPAAALRRLGAACRALAPSQQQPAAGLLWGMLLAGSVGTVGVHVATTFVSQGAWGTARKQMRDYVLKQPRVNVETTGNPIIGSPSAPILLVEFSDFLCPACQRASQLNTIILASHRRDAALIFKTYPLDMTCNPKVGRTLHPGACQIAAASKCAHLQGKFWAFHDFVFAQGPAYKAASIDGDIQRLGLDVPRFQACMASGQGMDDVKRDIAEGATLGITSTPTYVINGIPVAGGVNPSLFEEFVAALQGRP